VLVTFALALVLAAGVAAAVVLRLRRTPAPAPVRVLAEAAPAPPTISGDVDLVAALDALLAELEGTTVRIDGADELDGEAVRELERLAEMLEAAAESLAPAG
jgi:hypothetical protein